MPSTTDPESSPDGGAGTTAPPNPSDIGEFAKVPKKMLRELIEKGRQAAEELDQAIRSQFQIGGGGGGDNGHHHGDGSDFQ